MKSEIIDKFSVLITSAFGLVAALAWNDAIKGAIKNSGLERYGPWIYAISITLLAVLITIILSRIAEKAKSLEIKKYAKLVHIPECLALKKKPKAEKQ